MATNEILATSGSAGTTEPAQDAQRQSMDALVETSFVISGLVARVAGANDLSLTQLRVLAILRDHEPRMADLAQHLGLDRSTVSGLIDRAVARGLVARTPSPQDGRSSLVTLTADGRRTAEAIADEVAAAVAVLSDRLDPVEHATLLHLLSTALGRSAEAGG